MEAPDPRSALDDLFWRDEILQVLFWMQGEGLADAVRAPDLLPFLSGDLSTIRHHLDRCADAGHLHRDEDERGPTYALTEVSRAEAGRRFAEAFAGMQKPAHGECSADCDCQGDPSLCSGHHH